MPGKGKLSNIEISEEEKNKKNPEISDIRGFLNPKISEKIWQIPKSRKKSWKISEEKKQNLGISSAYNTPNPHPMQPGNDIHIVTDIVDIVNVVLISKYQTFFTLSLIVKESYY